MADTNVYMDWTSVGITPAGGTEIVFTETLDVDIDDNIQIQEWIANGRLYSTVAVPTAVAVGIRIRHGDLNKTLLASLFGKVISFTGKLNDSLNREGEGCLIATATKCMMGNRQARGPSRRFANGELNLVAFSTDGIAYPISYTKQAATP